jgi:hypothetical protein
MNEARLREALREAPVPNAEKARGRALAMARASYSSAPAARRPRRHALQVAVAIGLIAALVSPAGAQIRHWVRDAVEVGHQPSLPALTSLPAPGSLLVDSPRGPWVVHADGSKRLLGSYSQSTWSPHGLFVAATGRHQLAAVNPEGDVHWTLSRLGPVRDPAWSPDGERIAYLNGGELRVVDGDGTDDRPLAIGVAPVAPAWRRGGDRRLSFVDSSGRVRTMAVDTGRVLARFEAPPRTFALAWSADGSRLLVASRGELQLRTPAGDLLWSAAPPPGMSFGDAVLSPLSSAEVVATAAMRSGAQSQLLRFGPGGARQRLFAGLGRLGNVLYAPNGRWLLVAWRSADQWFFLNPDHPRRIVAISDISRQFDPGTTSPPRFPSVAGWCCPHGSPAG